MGSKQNATAQLEKKGTSWPLFVVFLYLVTLRTGMYVSGLSKGLNSLRSGWQLTTDWLSKLGQSRQVSSLSLYSTL